MHHRVGPWRPELSGVSESAPTAFSSADSSGACTGARVLGMENDLMPNSPRLARRPSNPLQVALRISDNMEAFSSNAHATIATRTLNGL
jgi:hypothetical protein